MTVIWARRTAPQGAQRSRGQDPRGGGDGRCTPSGHRRRAGGAGRATGTLVHLGGSTVTVTVMNDIAVEVSGSWEMTRLLFSNNNY